jgi:protein-tyrosine kinase
MKSFPNSLSHAFAAAKAKVAAPQWTVTNDRPRHAPTSHAAPGTLNTSAKDGFVFISAPRSEAADRYRRIAAAVIGGDWPRKRILVTSPGSGDGKTLTSVNLALALSERGQSVFLAELSLMRPRYRFVFGSPSAAGVESVLKGQIQAEEITFQLGDTRIGVASVAMPMPSNDLLKETARLDTLLKLGERDFQWTILDVPSVSEYPAIGELAAQAGPVVMVARSRKTKMKVFRQAAAELGADLDYVLLNDVA